jgi:hypothetical protein
MAYRKIQGKLHRAYGIDHHKIYVEGFSESVHVLRKKDLHTVRQFNFDWHHSFYENCTAFELLKVEERADFKAVLADANAPWWPRVGEPSAGDFLLHNRRANRLRHFENDDVDSDVDMGADEQNAMARGDGNPHLSAQEVSGDNCNQSIWSPTNKLYMSRDRVPPIMMCLLYDPLMGMAPNISRTEWEQKIGGLPSFHLYCMYRAIYSSSSNPLLKPEHFMPEAVDMSATERWKEYMGEGDNPLINFYVAGELHGLFAVKICVFAWLSLTLLSMGVVIVKGHCESLFWHEQVGRASNFKGL